MALDFSDSSDWTVTKFTILLKLVKKKNRKIDESQKYASEA